MSSRWGRTCWVQLSQQQQWWRQEFLLLGWQKPRRQQWQQQRLQQGLLHLVLLLPQVQPLLPC
jgi:hypothetical protein